MARAMLEHIGLDQKFWDETQKMICIGYNSRAQGLPDIWSKYQFIVISRDKIFDSLGVCYIGSTSTFLHHLLLPHRLLFDLLPLTSAFASSTDSSFEDENEASNSSMPFDKDNKLVYCFRVEMWELPQPCKVGQPWWSNRIASKNKISTLLNAGLFSQIQSALVGPTSVKEVMRHEPWLSAMQTEIGAVEGNALGR